MTKTYHRGIAAVIALTVLGGAALAVAVGAGIPTLPATGPVISLPATVTVTTSTGKTVVLHRTFASTDRVYFTRQNTQFVGSTRFTVETIDPVDHVQAHVPVIFAGSDSLEPSALTGEYRRTRLSAEYADSISHKVEKASFPDFSLTYNTASGSGLPQISPGESETLKAGTVFPSVTSADKTVAAIAPFGHLGDEGIVPEKARNSWGFNVYFDLAALHREGKTSMIYPLAWYANPFFRVAQPVAAWLCVGLWAVAIFLFLRIALKRGDDKASARPVGHWLDGPSPTDTSQE
jgi:hypothetical protein